MTLATVTLEPKLDLRAASELRSALLDLKGQDVVLDAVNVDHFGALALQVVRAASKTWAEAGASFGIENVSSDLSDQLTLLGYTPDNLTTWETAQ
ncbi:MAG: STAS domain-containing protein [Maritimibacter sp.]